MRQPYTHAALLLSLLLAASSADAKPEFVDMVNQYCTAANRLPLQPIPVAFPSSCEVCHQRGFYDKLNVVEPAFSEFKEGKKIENFSFFCPTLVNANQAPVLDPIGNRAVGEGETLVVAITARDPDGNPLRFSTSNLPPGAEFTPGSAGTAELRWTPGFDQAGNYPLSVMVEDNASPPGSASESITISVGGTNRPPVLGTIGDRSVSEGGDLLISITASDPDEDGLSFSAADLPTGSAFRDLGNGSAELRWAPGYDQAGNYPVRFSVVDAGAPVASDSEQITITVGPVNRAPTLSSIGDRTIVNGDSLRITLAATDPDGDGLRFTAAGLPSGARFADLGNGSAEFEWMPSRVQTGNHRVTFTVTDTYVQMASDFEEVTLTVGAAANRPPVLDPIGNRMVPAAERFQLYLTASDPDGNALRFTATGLPPGAELFLGGDGSTHLEWLPGYDQTGNHSVTFAVSDDGVPSESDFEQVTITVGAVNRPPVLDPLADRRARVGELLTLAILARDPDGDRLRCSAEPLPAGAQLNDRGDGTAELVWTPSESQVGDHIVLVSVFDDATPPESDSESLMIRVEAPAPVGESVRVERARFRILEGRLEVKGEAWSGASVEILDAMTGATLGSVMAYDEGEFSFHSRPLIVPCSIVARVGATSSGIVPVEGAPANCSSISGAGAAVRVKAARWDCEKHRLQVIGDRAPSGATIVLRDAASDLRLGETHVTREGKFALRLVLPAPPDQVQVGVLNGTDSIWLKPVPVEQTDETCEEQR